MNTVIQIRKIGENVFKHIDQKGFILIDSYVKLIAKNYTFSIITQKMTFHCKYDEIELYDDTNLGSKETFNNPDDLVLRLNQLGYGSYVQNSTDLKLDNLINNVLTNNQLRATPIPISPRPNTSGINGTTAYKLISLASTNVNIIKNSGGNLYSIVAIGLSSTVRFLKLYNKATLPTLGTDIPLMTIPIPANTQGAGISIPFSMGVNFPLGISIAITSGSADNDSVGILANEVLINLTYA